MMLEVNNSEDFCGDDDDGDEETMYNKQLVGSDLR